jgi:hypothetical protein
MTMPSTNKEQYFLARPTHTIGFRGGAGNVRDYFVVFFEDVMKDQMPLFLHMGK